MMMGKKEDERCYIDGNVRVYKFYSSDHDSHAEFDHLFCRHPRGNLRVFFDNKIVIECLEFDQPDYEEEDFKLFKS